MEIMPNLYHHSRLVRSLGDVSKKYIFAILSIAIEFKQVSIDNYIDQESCIFQNTLLVRVCDDGPV